MVEVFELPELDNLYPHLGLTHVDVVNARCDGSTAKQKEKNVLRLWRDRNAQKATRAVLLKAMGRNEHWKKWTSQLKERWERRPGKLKSNTLH